MKVKKIFSKVSFYSLCICAIGTYGYVNQNCSESDMFLENISALASSEVNYFDGSPYKLCQRQCMITKVNYGSGFYYHGVWIASGATYTVYGISYVCEASMIGDNCDFSKQTSCFEQ